LLGYSASIRKTVLISCAAAAEANDKPTKKTDDLEEVVGIYVTLADGGHK
jgi:hypothetical protein